MTREEHVYYCRKCQNRELDPNQGLTCRLTGKVATFENQCPDFLRDEKVAEQTDLLDDGSAASTNQLLADPGVLKRLLDEQDLKKGILYGFLAGIVGAGIWGLITVLTGYQIGYMAIGMGFLVGFSIRSFGNGVEPVFGYWGAGISLFSCVLGNFFSLVGFVAREYELGFIETLKLLDYSLLPEIMVETFNPIDILFYALALYFGYKYSFRIITQDDLK